MGVGTLYRHFPSREALVAATYRHEVEQLCDSVSELQATLAPDAALRAWMDGFVRYTATKRGMGEALQAVMASDSAIFANTYARLVAALDALLAAAVAAGTIRPDARGEDVLRALGAIWMTRESESREEQAGRVLDLLMDGLRCTPVPPLTDVGGELAPVHVVNGDSVAGTLAPSGAAGLGDRLA